jgi:hypothetical protein
MGIVFFEENMVVASFTPLGVTAFSRLGGEMSSRGWRKDKTGKIIQIPRDHPEYPADYLYMENIPFKKAVYLLPEKGLNEAKAKPFHISNLFTVIQIDTDEEVSKEETNKLAVEIKKAMQKAKLETVDTFVDQYIFLIDWQNKALAYEAVKSLAQVYI